MIIVKFFAAPDNLLKITTEDQLNIRLAHIACALWFLIFAIPLMMSNFNQQISKKVDFVNSVSLLNIQSINDFEKKTNKSIDASIFRGNLCIDEIEPWKEREWIGEIIKINNVSFKVEKNIPRCVAINLKPKTDDNVLNLLQSLKKNYNHFEMGIYLTALDDGEINLGDKVEIII